MLVAGYAFTNGSIRLKEEPETWELEIYHGKRLEFVRIIPKEIDGMKIYEFAKEILRSETEAGYARGIERVAFVFKKL